MLEGIEVLTHSSIKIEKEKTIYFDPFQIDKNYMDADYIFITHEHYDHFSPEDIMKILNNDTKIIMPESMNKNDDLYNFENNQIIFVEPNKEYIIDNLKFETIPSYNIGKPFHPKNNNWVGYIVTIDNYRYYIAGDTDVTEENSKISCDVAFLPVGGKYTMDYTEASKLANTIKPEIAIPTHYGSIVGKSKDGMSFAKLLDVDIKYKIYIL